MRPLWLHMPEVVHALRGFGSCSPQAGTTADKVLSIMADLLEGRVPSVEDVVMVSEKMTSGRATGCFQAVYGERGTIQIRPSWQGGLWAGVRRAPGHLQSEAPFLLSLSLRRLLTCRCGLPSSTPGTSTSPLLSMSRSLRLTWT